MGCLVPHAPILIPEIASQENATSLISATTESLRKITDSAKKHAPDTIVILYPPHLHLLSPYGFSIEVETRERPSSRYHELEKIAFGSPDELLIDSIVELATTRGLDVKKEPHRGENDWGQIVPLYFVGGCAQKLVSIPVSPNLSLVEHYLLGISIKEAAETTGTKVLLVASGDMSHRLRGSHYGYHPSGEKFDQAILKIIDSGKFKEVFELDPQVVEDAGQDSLWSISVLFGAFDGYLVESKVLSYEAPFGIGYMVAVVTPIEPDESRKIDLK